MFSIGLEDVGRDHIDEVRIVKLIEQATNGGVVEEQAIEIIPQFIVGRAEILEHVSYKRSVHQLATKPVVCIQVAVASGAFNKPAYRVDLPLEAARHLAAELNRVIQVMERERE